MHVLRAGKSHLKGGSGSTGKEKTPFSSWPKPSSPSRCHRVLFEFPGPVRIPPPPGDPLSTCSSASPQRIHPPFSSALRVSLPALPVVLSRLEREAGHDPSPSSLADSGRRATGHGGCCGSHKGPRLGLPSVKGSHPGTVFLHPSGARCYYLSPMNSVRTLRNDAILSIVKTYLYSYKDWNSILQ